MKRFTLLTLALAAVLAVSAPQPSNAVESQCYTQWRTCIYRCGTHTAGDPDTCADICDIVLQLCNQQDCIAGITCPY